MTPATRMEGDSPMNRYRFDPMALIAGLVFTGIAIAYILQAGGALSVSAEWSLAAAVIGVGVAGLAGVIRAIAPGTRHIGTPMPPEPLDEPYTPPTVDLTK
ncbi:hypothetical protein [Embleya sp. NBC_00896]|uniref:hypothetical protein n=1 Tax=Embleya sp. NBC_00896 TaxID=2975961 RepID=UPI003867E331|nr:hypothetical protein OG928_13185 [Embleya sp. NBC_00896]